MTQAVEDNDIIEEVQDAVETPEPEEQPQAEDTELTTDQAAEDDDDEITVSIGEESPPTEQPAERAPEWVRELRKSHREALRQNRELKAALAAREAPSQRQAPLGPKPTLESCDYDAEKYEQSIESWHIRKRQADAEAEMLEAKQREANQAWAAKLEAYSKARSELKVKDFEDAEATATELFDVTQQGVVVQGAENPALVIYALGKNPKKAQELAEIKDPVKFAFAIAKLETQLKVSNRKTPPPPMKTAASGSAPVSANSPAGLDRLRKEAAASGDYTKYLEAKRALKQ